MKVHIKFFAIFRETFGKKSDWVELPENSSVEECWKLLKSQSQRVGNIRAAYAVNQRLVKPEHVLRDGDEVAFLPPVSGGAKKRKPQRTLRAQRKIKKTFVKDAMIANKPINMSALVKRVEFPGAGAILVFSGVVRNNARGKEISHLEYEAYPEMAEATMREIIAEIKSRWHEVRAAMVHRVGRLEIGDASLVIAVAAPHRPEAYAASRYAIERVKAVLPVWKKEFATDAEYWVEGPVAGDLLPEKAEAIVEEAERKTNE